MLEGRQSTCLHLPAAETSQIEGIAVRSHGCSNEDQNPGKLMKIIFSRKGWDSAAGRKPSPIFSNNGSNNGFSIPIPEVPPNPNPILYRHLTPSALSITPYPNLASFIGVYAPGFPVATNRAHLDPDLDHSTLARGHGWVPCFGQENGAASHLDNQNVGI